MKLEIQNGILLVDKSRQWTSHDVVNLVRRRFKLKKVGHCGTLDPSATGLLILVLGKATKISQKLMGQYKVYQVTMKFGEATNTQDSDGKIVKTAPFKHITPEKVHEVIQKKFIGSIKQVPPMTSAIKHKGKPLYKLARKGIKIERKAREINIYNISIDDISLPEIRFRITCSKGTYVRTLCNDIGESLDSCAYMSELSRLQSGNFHLLDAIPVDKIKQVTYSQLRPFIIPLEDYLQQYKIAHFHNLKQLRYNNLDKIALAIGNFDGVHLGHQKILRQLVKQAQKNGSTPLVMTFHPHPKEILNNQKLSKINSLEQQVEQLENLGIKGIIHLPFSKEFARQTPGQFVNSILKNQSFTLTDICVGEDWRFGAKKAGDSKLLQTLLPKTKIHSFAKEKIKGNLVSSSLIRNLINQSNFEQIAQYLGRRYSIVGRVEYGIQLANNHLLYPTANIRNHTFLSLQGVFLVKVFLEELEQYFGICNIGYTPTVQEQEEIYQKVEVHILDFNRDIYGKMLQIIPLKKIRDEKQFDNLENLQQQIYHDKEEVLTLISKKESCDF